MNDLELKAFLEEHYTNVRQLDDGTWVCTHDLMFTRSLIIGLNEWGWERRYCYKDRELAVLASQALQSGDDQPLPGYIASRGVA